MDQHPKFAILVTYTTGDSNHSRFYFGQPCLDFQIYRAEGRIAFTEMRCLNYTLSLQKSSKKDLVKFLDPEGGPNQWDWRTENLELHLGNHNGK